jgi:hypothetical protein
LTQKSSTLQPPTGHLPVPYQHGQTLQDLRDAHYPRDIDVVVPLNGVVIGRSVCNILSGRRPAPPFHMSTADRKGDKSVYRTVPVRRDRRRLVRRFRSPEQQARWSAWASLSWRHGVNALLPPPTRSDACNSFRPAAHSWNPQTIQQQGNYPRLYGTNRLYGNILNTFTDIVDGKNRSYPSCFIGLGPQRAPRFQDRRSARGEYQVTPKSARAYQSCS